MYSHPYGSEMANGITVPLLPPVRTARMALNRKELYIHKSCSLNLPLHLLPSAGISEKSAGISSPCKAKVTRVGVLSVMLREPSGGSYQMSFWPCPESSNPPAGGSIEKNANPPWPY